MIVILNDCLLEILSIYGPVYERREIELLTVFSREAQNGSKSKQNDIRRAVYKWTASNNDVSIKLRSIDIYLIRADDFRH